MFEVYKTINNVNGKYYVGVHSTSSKPNYLGSGKILVQAIKRYGRSNFTKEVLFLFNTPEEAYDKEAEIVNELFISDRNTYNVTNGGGNPPTFYRDHHHLSKISTKTVEHVCSSYLQGATSEDLGLFFGASKSTICRILKKNNIKARKSGNRATGKNSPQYKEKPVDYIISSYEKGVSAYKLAKELNLSSGTIVTLLRNNNVAIRNRKKQTT